LSEAVVVGAPEAPQAAPKPRTLSPQAQEGRELYLNKSVPQCGICHTLEDAGTKGVVGPNLNALKPEEAQVLSALKQGIGAMPPQTTLSEEQLKALARYVFEATR
jgi:mono/diheme cytochrome c family protein